VEGRVDGGWRWRDSVGSGVCEDVGVGGGKIRNQLNLSTESLTRWFSFELGPHQGLRCVFRVLVGTEKPRLEGVDSSSG
jgi:hypothetical protein